MRQRNQRSKTPTRQIYNSIDTLYENGARETRKVANNIGGKSPAPPYSMYKESDPSNVKLTTQGAIYFGDKMESLTRIATHMYPRLLKENRELCRIDKALIVRDLSMKVRASDEDEAFAQNPELWLNFRRGNTLIEIYDP